MRIALTVVSASSLRDNESAPQTKGWWSIGLVSVTFIIVTSASRSRHTGLDLLYAQTITLRGLPRVALIGVDFDTGFNNCRDYKLGSAELVDRPC